MQLCAYSKTSALCRHCESPHHNPFKYFSLKSSVVIWGFSGRGGEKSLAWTIGWAHTPRRLLANVNLVAAQKGKQEVFVDVSEAHACPINKLSPLPWRAQPHFVFCLTERINPTTSDSYGIKCACVCIWSILCVHSACSSGGKAGLKCSDASQY